jgi:hypothetical protein
MKIRRASLHAAAARSALPGPHAGDRLQESSFCQQESGLARHGGLGGSRRRLPSVVWLGQGSGSACLEQNARGSESAHRGERGRQGLVRSTAGQLKVSQTQSMLDVIGKHLAQLPEQRLGLQPLLRDRL